MIRKRTGLPALCLILFLLAACKSTSTAEITPTSLAGFQVIDPQGKAAGEVETALIDADGQISYIIVTLKAGAFHYTKAAFVPGSLSRTAVPWRFFTIDPASEQLQLQVDSAVVSAAPHLIDDPDQLESNWDEPFRAYWQTQQSVNSRQ